VRGEGIGGEREGEDRVTLRITLLIGLIGIQRKDTFVTSGCLFRFFFSFFLSFGVSKFKHVLHFYSMELRNILYNCMDWVGPHVKTFFLVFLFFMGVTSGG
jgi:hypothetical protein